MILQEIVWIVPKTLMKNSIVIVLPKILSNNVKHYTIDKFLHVKKDRDIFPRTETMPKFHKFDNFND